MPSSRAPASSSAERCASLLRGTLEATSDGILVVDREGGLVTFNDRFLQLWNIPADLARSSGNQALIQYVADQVSDPEKFVDLTRENQAHPDRECFAEIRFRDGRVVERLCRPQRIDSEIVGRVLAFTDVSERERLLVEARQAARERIETLSIAAHEIRGPISSMRLAVQCLRDGRWVSGLSPQALDIIDRSQRRVAALVEKLLDLGRLQAGPMDLDLEPIDLVEVVREAIARQQAELQSSGSNLWLQTDQPVVGLWDRLRLDQVVTNLLSNAIKFGWGKPIRVEVRATPGRAVLEVQDQGMGIPLDVQCRIFEAFARATAARPYSGTGLGLYVVRTIVEAMGGTVRVASEPGAGATFRVELPRTAR